MRAFRGYRPQPPEDYTNKGLSNGGWIPDYEGIEFADGTVAVRWLTAYRSVSIWENYGTFYKVHGHPEYGTRIVEYELGPEDCEHPLEAVKWNPYNQVVQCHKCGQVMSRGHDDPLPVLPQSGD